MTNELIQISTPLPAYLQRLEEEFGLDPGSLEGLSAEALLVHIARVSSERANTVEDPAGLIQYLIRNKHWSPFEHTYATMEVVTSRAIARQLLRHRSFTFQEFSQRYAEVSSFEQVELRAQADTNRQSSTTVVNPEVQWDPAIPRMDANTAVVFFHDTADKLYRALLHAGVARETARMILPQSATTKLYMTGSLRSWIHYIQIRDDEHAQKEAQLIARAQSRVLAQYFPHTFAAL